jgi:hypothetical protein
MSEGLKKALLIGGYFVIIILPVVLFEGVAYPLSAFLIAGIAWGVNKLRHRPEWLESYLVFTITSIVILALQIYGHSLHQ